MKKAMNVRLLASVVAILAVVISGCASTGSTGSSGSGGSSNGYGEKGTAKQEAARVNVEMGARYMQQGRLELAKSKLDKALSLDPNSADGHTVIAILYDRLGKIDDAEHHYKRAVKADPENADALNNLGTFLCKSGELREAEKRFQQAIDQPFYNTPEVALTNAGKCVMRIPDQPAAERYFRQAIDANPRFPDALYNMALLNVQRDDYLRARAFLQRFEAVARHQPDSLALGIRIEQALGDQRAVGHYQKILKSAYPESEQAKSMGDPS